jgi:hypothetical protein
MGKIKLLLMVVIISSTMIIVGACTNPSTTDETLSVAELMENPVYNAEFKIEGSVSLLGELFCPCFELTSGGETLMVYYGLMVEDDGTERISVSVEGIENGDHVIVTGELKSGGIYHSLNDFWASSIEKTN